MNSFAKVNPPKRVSIIITRFLVLLGIAAIFRFVFWYFDTDHIGNSWLFAVLSIAILFKLMRMVFEWYHYAFISVPERPDVKPEYTVDMLTTYVPGEPYDMVENTLKAMVAVRYPHTTYLCDEGDDPYLKDLCEKLGVVHVYRGKDKTNAKAGNINYALRNKAKGEITVILDPDHIPVPEFLDRVLPYFEDEEIGYVQCVQGYYNRNESFVAKAAAEQTYMFYGPMMMGMHTHGTAQAIGANCAFRREALDSIGGHAPGLCEDMHTSMLLHAKKWKCVYIPEMLTKGLVPATLSAYYKQQLKWSRGAFELLFEVVPKIFRKLSFRQKIHYTVAPLYYLYGVIGLIDISVPIISLLTQEVPLFIDIKDFFLALLPLFLINLLLRQYSQRYVMESHELGFHFLGGTLRAGTWWVFLIGFIYSLFRVKVPYLPTPKGDDLVNEWKLSFPNIVAIGLSVFAIVFGLSTDWNPYNWFMAGFAGINVMLLGIIVFVGLQKSISGFYHELYFGKLAKFRKKWFILRHNSLYQTLRNPRIALVLVLGAFFASFLAEQNYFSYLQYQREINPEKVSGAFIEGAYAKSSAVYPLSDKVKKDLPNAVVISVDVMGKDALKTFTNYIENDLDSTQLPVLYWSHHAVLPDSGVVSPWVFPQIYKGYFNYLIDAWAKEVNRFDRPMLMVWDIKDPSPYKENRGLESLYAFEYVVSRFKENGVAHVGWVWPLDLKEDSLTNLPAEGMVDLIAISAKQLDYPIEKGHKYISYNATDSIWLSLAERDFPILVTDLEEQQKTAVSLATTESKEDVVERMKIQGILSFPNLADSGIVIQMPSSTEVEYNLTMVKDSVIEIEEDRPQLEKSKIVDLPIRPSTIPYDSLNSAYAWEIDGEPYYIKGVAYNPEHDWRDGEWPLTNKQLHEDFQLIREMGANTIRRYSPTLYDRNILNVAAKEDLKVLYGFWFAADKDYYASERAWNTYRKQVKKYVALYKDEPAISAWVVGNETWGSLKHHFHQPYLTTVRERYLEMVESLAQMIHEMDPNRPVISVIEYSPDIKAAVKSFHKNVPSLDALGVNVYYKDHIQWVDTILQTYYPGKPYLVSEYGPPGYWDQELSDLDEQDRVWETTSFHKARLYAQHWDAYIEEFNDNNLGGVAFCWKDRMEGTATWFGITDSKGRLKPAYYALKNTWTGSQDTFPLADVRLVNITPNEKLNDPQYHIRAVSANNTRSDLFYEWTVRENEYLFESSSIEIKQEETTGFQYRISQALKRRFFSAHLENKGLELRVSQSSQPKDQRVYLHISDENNHVITTSIPINILED